METESFQSTDPRATKLRDIIEKGKASLTSSLEEIQLMGEAIKGKDFTRHSFEDLSFHFWKRYRPPINRKYREGLSEVDLTITFRDGVIFVEAKYLAPVRVLARYVHHTSSFFSTTFDLIQ